MASKKAITPAPEAPKDWSVDTKTGEYISAATGKRYRPETARALIAKLKQGLSKP